MPMLDVYIPDGALTTDRRRRSGRPDSPTCCSPMKASTRRTPGPGSWHGSGFTGPPECSWPANRRTGPATNSCRRFLRDSMTTSAVRRFSPMPLRLCSTPRSRWARTRDPNIVWVFPTEDPRRHLGRGGQIVRLGDIAALVLGSPEKGQSYAQRVLAARREEQLRPPDPSSCCRKLLDSYAQLKGYE